jgi:hypothetical protein
VDIEFKRRCSKVKFCKWVAVVVMLYCIDQRLNFDLFHAVRIYAEVLGEEQEAKDHDNLERRRIFAELVRVVKEAFERDQRWSNADQRRAELALSSTSR